MGCEPDEKVVLFIVLSRLYFSPKPCDTQDATCRPVLCLAGVGSFGGELADSAVSATTNPQLVLFSFKGLGVEFTRRHS